MTMLQNTLSVELRNMVPVDNEPDGIENFASAWEAYFSDATVSGVTVTTGTLAGPKAAMKAAMAGVANIDSATAIQLGIVAFWGAVSASASAIWITVPPLVSATPPPTLPSIAAAVGATGMANIAGELGLTDACSAMASTIHPLNLGGLAVNTSVPPVSIPVL